MDPMYRKFMIRCLAAAQQNICYINIYIYIFKMITDHNVYYTVNRNGVLFDLSPTLDEVVRQIDQILKRREQRKQVASVCTTTVALSCEIITQAICLFGSLHISSGPRPRHLHS